MRPAGMLAHRRRDGNAFCDHESYRVDGNGDRSRIEAGRRILDNCHGIVFACAAGHGDERIRFVFTARRRRGRRDADGGVVMVVGIRSAYVQFSELGGDWASFQRRASGVLMRQVVQNISRLSLWTRQAEQLGINN